MKKIAILIMAILFLFPLVVSAGDKALSAVWEQVLPEPNDLDGWKLAWAVQTDPQTWEPANQIDIDYLGGTTGEYTTDFTFTSPDGQRVTYVFRMLAYDIVGNKSNWAMAAEPVTIDFEAPGVPGNFSITIKVVPSP